MSKGLTDTPPRAFNAAPPTARAVSEVLEITQADREAAITFGHAGIVWRFYEGNERDMRAGTYDDERLIRAFAAHRIATLARETEAKQ